MDKQPKTLGDAIRLGASKTGRCTRALFSNQNDTPHTCAIGAALVGIGLSFEQIRTCPTTRGLEILSERFNIKRDIFAPCPIQHAPYTRYYHSDVLLLDFIVTLNDIMGWSREQIADWVDESLNQKKEPFVNPAPIQKSKDNLSSDFLEVLY